MKAAPIYHTSFPLQCGTVRLKALVWIARPDASGAPQLLLLRRPNRRGGGEHPVTGKADAGESPLACAAREVEEETGFRGAPIELPYVHRYRAAGAQFEEHAFFLRVAAGEEPRLSSEHASHRWVPVAEAKEVVHWQAHREALALLLARWKPD